MSGAPSYLVLIEAQGIQEYLFASNKLSEAVGASELVARVGTTWLDDALRTLGHSARAPLPEGDVEVITAASGKAIVLTTDVALARDLVTTITSRALREAPGLEVTGIVEPVKCPFGGGGVHAALTRAYGRLADAHLT